MQDGSSAGGGGEGSIQLLLSILADGEEQARQLGELPDDPPWLGAEHYRSVARRLQCTLGKAVSVAKAIEAAASSSGRGTNTDSPRSADEMSSGGTAAVEAQEHQGVCKRRKGGLPRWTAKFRVPDASLEATPDDGFSWRKYGQKDILGAKFPRGYYRCTYRTAQGCPATKQVQRSDSDLCVFDVTYQGDHTCHQKQRHATGGTASPHNIIGQPPPPPQDPSVELLLPCFNDRLKVETAEAPLLHASSHGGVLPADDTVAACFSSSPGAGSSYYDYDYGYDLPGAPRVRGVESELAEVVSRATAAPAAAADLSASGFDYSLSSLYHQGEFDPHLPFAPSGGGPPHY